ncbi:hypothetical protein [Labrenzia sp. OB1]|uniref:hypothetical protein n=1 Tax=Labrenzia sp. OB1 TaxID=1561204 RepID=UPI0007B1ABA2|nr:hypothetical protein [Labrenzia sp. OB1]KZM46955.1 hypothetical protein OA90_26545 [Labrenzia sp. OB1]
MEGRSRGDSTTQPESGICFTMKKPAVWLAVGAAIPISFIVAWMLLDNACDGLGSDKVVSECWRGWVGSWSGWGAAAGAIFAAWWAVTETKRQTKKQANQFVFANVEQQLDDLIRQQKAVKASSEALSDAIEWIRDIGDPKHQTPPGQTALRELFERVYLPRIESHREDLTPALANSLATAKGIMEHLVAKLNAEPRVAIFAAQGCADLCKPVFEFFEAEAERLQSAIEKKQKIRNLYGDDILAVSEIKTPDM